MSAICGVFYKNKAGVNRPLIEAMTASMQHLGLDRSAVWHQPSVALGQQITHTTPESVNEQLPFYHPEYRVALAANARLDNRSELCSLLNLPPTINDSQLILHAYMFYGKDLVSHLIGDFALAIWNDADQSLFCASDSMNSRPLYYFNNSELFAFASEIRALHTLPEIKREFNLHKVVKLVSFAALLCQDDTSTYFSNINYLPGNKCLEVSRSEFRQYSYWQPDLERELQLRDEAEYVEAFQDIFSRAIRARFRGNSAIMLSGGLDSSAIAAVACRLPQFINQDLPAEFNQSLQLEAFCNTLPAGYQGSASDEREFIKLNANNLNLNYLDTSRDGPFDNLTELLQAVESPNYISQQYIHRAFAEKMHAKNVRCVVDGLYGEIGPSSNGDGYLTDLFRAFKWRTCLAESAKVAQVENINFYKLLLNTTLPPRCHAQLSRIFKRKVNERERYSGLPLNADFVDEYLPREQRSKQITPVNKLIPLHRQNQYSALLIKQNRYPIYSYIEKTGIELVHPYLDRRILEFCLQLPGRMKINHGYRRYLVRRSMQGIMPEAICRRLTKSPFIPDYLDSYSQNLDQARALIEQIAANPLVQQVLDLKKLKAMLPNSNFKGELMGGQNMLATFVIPISIGLGVFLTLS